MDKLPWEPTEIISGAARGADNLGAVYAYDKGIFLWTMPADWVKHGKKAGILRNLEMAKHADALVAFWDGKSKGTKHMIQTAIDRGLYIKVIYYEYPT